jgi:hypothetical protein
MRSLACMSSSSTGRVAERTPRKAERARWRDIIIGHLKDFPRQYAALENALNAFGDDFELPAFKAASDTTDDMEAYNRVQAVERAVARRWIEQYIRPPQDQPLAN